MNQTHADGPSLIRIGFGLATLLLSVSLSASCADSIAPDDAPITDLGIVKTASAHVVSAGDTVRSFSRVRNHGPLAASSVFVGDTLPTGLSYVSHQVSQGQYSQLTGIWAVGSLPVDSEATLSILAYAEPAASGQTLVHRAGVLSTAFRDLNRTNDTSSVAVQVIASDSPPPPPPPPPPAGITTLATINWTNGTGTSVAAWTDGSTNRNVLCNPSTVNPIVRAAAQEGWNGPGNVLRMQNTTAGCGGLLLQDLMPVPASGHFWTLRWSYKQSADQIYDQVHTIVGFAPSAPGSGAKMILNRAGPLSAGNWYHVLGLAPSNFGWELRLPASPSTRRPLSPDTWYRFEMVIEWFGLNPQGNRQYRIYPRVYDAGNNLIATEANYVSDFIDGQSANISLATFYAGGGYLWQSAASLSSTNLAENVRDFWLGLSRSYATNSGNLYWAGVSVGTAGQATFYGPYAP